MGDLETNLQELPREKANGAQGEESPDFAMYYLSKSNVHQEMIRQSRKCEAPLRQTTSTESSHQDPETLFTKAKATIQHIFKELN